MVEHLEDVMVGGQFLGANVDVDVPEPNIIFQLQLNWECGDQL